MLQIVKEAIWPGALLFNLEVVCAGGPFMARAIGEVHVLLGTRVPLNQSSE